MDIWNFSLTSILLFITRLIKFYKLFKIIFTLTDLLASIIYAIFPKIHPDFTYIFINLYHN